MPESRIRMDDLDAIADAATLGMGIAWLPYWLVGERLRTGELELLLPAQALPGLMALPEIEEGG